MSELDLHSDPGKKLEFRASSNFVRDHIGTFGTFSLSIKDLALLMGPGVYALLSETEYLYIGSAKNILQRISDPAHHVIHRIWGEVTHVEVRTAISEANARAREMRMIQHWQPKYNIIGVSKENRGQNDLRIESGGGP